VYSIGNHRRGRKRKPDQAKPLIYDKDPRRLSENKTRYWQNQPGKRRTGQYPNCRPARSRRRLDLSVAMPICVC